MIGVLMQPLTRDIKTASKNASEDVVFVSTHFCCFGPKKTAETYYSRVLDESSSFLKKNTLQITTKASPSRFPFKKTKPWDHRASLMSLATRFGGSMGRPFTKNSCTSRDRRPATGEDTKPR